MKNEFLEKVEKIVNENKKVIALRSSNMPKGINYEKMWEYSGKIYSYLKSHNVGKEDFVFICLPRGIRIVLTMLGVWRAGSAFTIMESTSSPERIEYIKKDIKCKIVIDEEKFSEMMDSTYLDGYEEIEMHDASHAVYTSGTTGNPKGVLQEHGNIMEGVLGTKALAKDTKIGDVLAVISPMNFTASFLLIEYALYYGKCIYILSYDIAKNPNKLSKFLYEEKVAEIFMPPTLIKSYRDVSPFLKNVIVGGDISSRLFLEGPNLINNYGTSESCNSIASFVIDKPYDKIPVGKNRVGLTIKIVDENNIEVKKSEVGEICYESKYTRGYINLPEKTKEVFIDGYYHTGDLGYINEDDDLFICGRKDDMIKINGNRIEPAEIELSISEILNINNVMVKGFKDEREYICAYFLKDELKSKKLLSKNEKELEFDKKELSNKLSKKLPYYMIPTYYIVLESFPVNANGKPTRKALEAPKIDDYKDTYEAPTNEIEKTICDAFEKALNIEKVGIKDDFYLIGGDSLKSMEFMRECKLQGFTVAILNNERTPEKLAKYYEDNIENLKSNIDERNNIALSNPQDLSPKSLGIIDYQFFMPKTTMWNEAFLIKLNSNIDLDRLKRAVNKVLRHHPVFSTIFYFDEESNLKQKYKKEMLKDIIVIEISSDEFETHLSELEKPYIVLNSLLHKEVIYKTEKASYLFLDIHHSIIDGTSYKHVWQEIIDCYNDENTILKPDYYYLFMSDFSDYKKTDAYKSVVNEYEKQYKELISDSDYTMFPKLDKYSNKLLYAAYNKKLSANKTILTRDIIKKYGENVFFIAICLLAMAKYDNKKRVGLQWISSDRESSESINAVGAFIKSIPLMIEIHSEETFEQFLDRVYDKVKFGLANSNVQYELCDNDYILMSLFFVYQDNIFNYDFINSIGELVDFPKPNNAADSLFEFALINNNNDNNLSLDFEYSKGHYKEETIKNFSIVYDNILNGVINSKLIIKDLLKD